MSEARDTQDGGPAAPGNDRFDVSVRAARSRFARIEPLQVARFLASQSDVTGDVVIGEFDLPLQGAGMSNGIALFDARLDIGGGLQCRRFVLRYDPGVSLIKQKNFMDEYLTLRAAHRAGVRVPRIRWFDDGAGLLGCRGFVMDRVEGAAPPMSMFASGPLAEASPGQRKSMLLEAAGMMGQLKRMAIGPDLVPHLLRRGQGDDAILRELDWWLAEARLNAAETDERFRFIVRLHGWLRDHRPPARPATLTHGDGQIANMMFRDGHVEAWLDWELAYLGHQESDLMMILLVSELTAPPGGLEGIPDEAEYVARFERESGSGVEYFAYFKLLMLYKYLVGILFSADLIPDVHLLWQAIAERVERVWPEAAAEAGASR